MWPTLKKFTRVNNLIHIAMWLTPKSSKVWSCFAGERNFSLRVCNIQIRMYFANFYVYNTLHGATLANCSHFQYVSRSRRLIDFHKAHTLIKFWRSSKMDQSKKGFLPMLQGVKLSRTQCPTTAEDRENMEDVPYASAIGSIMYAMLCTRPDVCLAISSREVPK